MTNQSGKHEILFADASDSAYLYDLGAFPAIEAVPFNDQLVFARNSERYGEELWALSDPRPLAGDINQDGTVKLADFLHLSSEFGQRGESLASDVNEDGVVDLEDFVRLRSNFLQKRTPPPATPLELISPQRIDRALIVSDWLETANL